MGGVVALPLAYGILWAMGKAPDLEGLPFVGEAQKKLAGAPRPISEDRSPARNNFEPGRSLADDLPAGMLDSGQEASASDTGTSDSMPDAASEDGASNSDATNSVGGDAAADTAEVIVEKAVELPTVSNASDVKPSADDVKPATAIKPAVESATSTKPKTAQRRPSR